MCSELRRTVPRTAILAMNWSDDEQLKVEALDAGADDYVTPFHMRELTARVRAALRRSRATGEQDFESVVIGDIQILPQRRLVLKAGKAIHLTPKEFALLSLLARRCGEVLSRTLIAL